MIIQPPAFVRWLFPKCLWRLHRNGKGKYVALTFDDGPIPEQTPWVLDLLDENHIHATFFCVGENVSRYPQIYTDIIRRGHSVGNHTYNHLQLFKEGGKAYLANEEKGRVAMSHDVSLFRPPHGQLTPPVTRTLHRKYNKIVLWDVMPKDYDKSLTPDEVFDNVCRYVRNGSVIVFHDSIKAGERMRYALSQTIKHLKDNGYSFVSIDEAISLGLC